MAHYGYLVVFGSALVGSAGIPLPATELLIAAAAYAAHTHRLDVVVLAGGAAIMAGGRWPGRLSGIGKSVGAVTLARHGSTVGLGPSRLRLGQYLFLTHGGKIVFFIRFIAFLGPFGGVLAGVNRMPFLRFTIFNALGSLTWAVCVAAGGYLFGTFFASVGQPIGLGGSCTRRRAPGGRGFHLCPPTGRFLAGEGRRRTSLRRSWRLITTLADFINKFNIIEKSGGIARRASSPATVRLTQI